MQLRNRQGFVIPAIIIVPLIGLLWFKAFIHIDHKLHPGTLLNIEPIDRATGLVSSYDERRVHFGKQTDYLPSNGTVPTMTEEEWNAHLAAQAK